MNIFYYNKWRGVRVPEVHECFLRLDEEQIDSIEKGDEVWLDLEPYYHHGKVYGYSKVTIKDIDQTENNIRYSFESKQCSGFFTHTKGSILNKQIWKLTDEKKLEDLIEQYQDKITSIHTRGW